MRRFAVTPKIPNGTSVAAIWWSMVSGQWSAYSLIFYDLVSDSTHHSHMEYNIDAQSRML